jgi:hypothetical protein
VSVPIIRVAVQHCASLCGITPGTVTTESAFGGGVKVIVPLSADAVTLIGATSLPATVRLGRLSGITRSPAGSVRVTGAPSAGAVDDRPAPTSTRESVLTVVVVGKSKVRSGSLATPTSLTTAGPLVLGAGIKVMVVASWLTMKGSAPSKVTVLAAVKKVPAGAVIEMVSPSAGAVSLIVAASPAGMDVTITVSLRPSAFTTKLEAARSTAVTLNRAWRRI